MAIDRNLNRRNFMGLLAGGIAGIMLGGSKGRCETAKKPNFVIIFADDLGYGDIGGFGMEKSAAPTPNLDRMHDTDRPVSIPARRGIQSGAGWRDKRGGPAALRDHHRRGPQEGRLRQCLYRKVAFGSYLSVPPQKTGIR